jgi:hypothetical protein
MVCGLLRLIQDFVNLLMELFQHWVRATGDAIRFTYSVTWFLVIDGAVGLCSLLDWYMNIVNSLKAALAVVLSAEDLKHVSRIIHGIEILVAIDICMVVWVIFQMTRAALLAVVNFISYLIHPHHVQD